MSSAQSVNTVGDEALDAAPTPLLRRFEAFYGQFSEAPFEELHNIYADPIHFVDPVHEIEGLALLIPYLKKSLTNIRYCHFDFLQRIVGDGQVSYIWRMRFAHSKLNGGEEVAVPGMSYLRFDEQVTYHQDFYDMGAMVYEHVPVLRWGVQAIKKRIAS